MNVISLGWVLIVFTTDRRLSPFLAVNFVLEAYGKKVKDRVP